MKASTVLKVLFAFISVNKNLDYKFTSERERSIDFQDFLVKMEGETHVEEVVYRKGGKHCFSLVIYGFCSSSALYSASLSFRMSIVISD